MLLLFGAGVVTAGAQSPGGVKGTELWFQTLPVTADLQGAYRWMDLAGDSVKLRLYAHLSSWHTDPCRFPVKCGGICLLGNLYSLPSLGVKQSTLLFKFISTRYGLKFIPKEFFADMFITKIIIFNNISSPTISTFGFAIIHSFLVF